MIPVQFITHQTERYTYLESARLALEGGCRWIQLRMKNQPLDIVETTARKVQALCKDYNAIFIIDDYVELTQYLHADGVHLGLKDMPIKQAREQLGEEYLIGGTANTFDDILYQQRAGADYIGLGPFRNTTTKQKLSPLLGLEGYTTLMQRMRNEHITLPVVAIGGITRNDIPSLMRTGVQGIALSGAVLQANDPVYEMRCILKTTY